jgi:glycosyltransferase involved in cell wall biosynthesis
VLVRIAFYAPMKAPDYPTQSGDRRIARLILAALGAAGHVVDVASQFRSHDRAGDRRRQQRLRDLGGRLARRLLRRYRAAPAAHRPELWFTYHVYHKAPDWLGPPVAKALGIPYVIAEASFAPKQARGVWRIGHRAAGEAIAAAAAVFNLNPGDVACVKPLLGDPRRLVPLAPFVDTSEFCAPDITGGTREMLSRRHHLPAADTWLIAVAMMRSGNKRDSYQVLADALAMVEASAWRLIVVGDGAVRVEVEAMFASFPPGRVVFAGALGGDELRTLVAHCDLFVWPGVREPIGMAMLEAQAAGVPVVTGRGPGIAGIVEDGCTGRLVPRGDVAAFAGAVASLLDAPRERAALGTRARLRALKHHDIATASAALDRVLNGLRAGSWP